MLHTESFIFKSPSQGYIRITANWEAEAGRCDISGAKCAGILGQFYVHKMRENHGTVQVDDNPAYCRNFKKDKLIPLVHMEIKLEAALAATERDHWRAVADSCVPPAQNWTTPAQLTQFHDDYLINAQSAFILSNYEWVLASWQYGL